MLADSIYCLVPIAEKMGETFGNHISLKESSFAINEPCEKT